MTDPSAFIQTTTGLSSASDGVLAAPARNEGARARFAAKAQV
jgi:hypothetical protein